MKKPNLVLILLFVFLSTSTLIPCFGQEEKDQEKQERAAVEQIQRSLYTYDPAGRRDPFRDLLAGTEADEEAGMKTVSEMSIDDIILIGILKIKTNLTGIIRGPQGFPFRINEGDKFKDGFVLSVEERKIIFRKTKNRGIPLSRPINVTKEINPEER
jgi:Tfp pilus assembly protein PilP